MRDGPKTTGELTQEMGGLTRFAVMQHLGVLEESGLVLVRRDGRNRFNYSNPAAIRELFQAWVEPLASSAAEAAQHMRRYAEIKYEAIQHMSEQMRVVKIEMESIIAAPKEIVFKALTEEIGGWWPHRMVEGADMFYEPYVGGHFGERRSDGAGCLYGQVSLFIPNEKVVVSNVGFFDDYCATNTETVADDGGGTRYRKSLHLWGIVPEPLEKMLTEGSRQLVEQALKQYCENRGGENPK